MSLDREAAEYASKTPRSRSLHEEAAAVMPGIRAAAPKMPHALIELIFSQPYCRIANLVEHKIAARHTASASNLRT